VPNLITSGYRALDVYYGYSSPDPCTLQQSFATRTIGPIAVTTGLVS